MNKELKENIAVRFVESNPFEGDDRDKQKRWDQNVKAENVETNTINNQTITKLERFLQNFVLHMIITVQLEIL